MDPLIQKDAVLAIITNHRLKQIGFMESAGKGSPLYGAYKLAAGCCAEIEHKVRNLPPPSPSRDGGRMQTPMEGTIGHVDHGKAGLTAAVAKVMAVPKPGIPLVARLNAATRQNLEELYESMDAVGEDAMDAAALRTLLDWYDAHVEHAAVLATVKWRVEQRIDHGWTMVRLPDHPAVFDRGTQASEALRLWRLNRADKPMVDDSDDYRVMPTLVKP